MRFFNRESELAALTLVGEQAEEVARMVVITGRRRIGKTALSLEYVKDRPHLYLFVSRKSEPLLCEEFLRQIRNFLDLPVVGKITRLRDLFELLLEAGRKRPFVLVIDECQEFLTICPSLFSDLQNLWDRYKAQSQVMFLFMGSVYSLMNRIFQDAKEPLFGRADRMLHLHPFSIGTLSEILHEYEQPGIETLFDYYMVTGGAPKYVDILVTHALFDYDAIIDFMISEHSPFLEEGKNLLIEEFGKEYAIYFSILELIAEGRTSRSEIESVLQQDVGGYLERLECDYGVLAKHRPIHIKPQGRRVKYKIRDHFLNFWFRFIYRNRTAVEVGNWAYVKEAIHRNSAQYSGYVLERFFHDLFAASGHFNRVGTYWERGNINEIDLVAVNDANRQLVIAEIKRNRKKIDLNVLRTKATRLVAEYRGYEVEYLALSLEDAATYMRG